MAKKYDGLVITNSIIITIMWVIIMIFIAISLLIAGGIIAWNISIGPLGWLYDIFVNGPVYLILILTLLFFGSLPIIDVGGKIYYLFRDEQINVSPGIITFMPFSGVAINRLKRKKWIK